MTFLIDGYNLLHAIGWAPPKAKGRSLETARRKLLDWLAETVPVKTGSDTLRVIFDAQNGPAPSSGHSHCGVLFQFAFRETADDAIEHMLDAETNPRQVAVVSNDHRLMQAARRVGATGHSCQEFLDLLIEKAKRIPGSPHFTAPEKPESGPSETERAEYYEVFRQIRNG